MKPSQPNIKTRIRSALRLVWLYSPLRREAMAKARVSRGIYRCAKCRKLFGPKQVDVDHKVKVTPKGITPEQNPIEYWGTVIWNLFYCGVDGLWVLCKPCHKEKTKSERRLKKKKVTRKKKRTSRKRKRR